MLPGVALQVSPPFAITEAEIGTLVDGLEAVFSDLAAATAARR